MTALRAFLIRRLGTVASTMEEAAALASAGAPEGTVVVAESQSAGRGRAGRPWSDAPGRSLLCTVLLRPSVPPERLGLLSLVAGVAVAEAIEQSAGVPARLKWPNDVWLGDDPARRKVAGILLQARTGPAAVDHALVGIGVNVTSPETDLPPGGTSLLVAVGREIGRDELLASLLNRLADGYADFCATGGFPDLDPWRRRAALLGEDVAVEQAGVTLVGRFVGVDDDGALLLQDDGGVRRIVAGDLVRGPQRAT